MSEKIPATTEERPLMPDYTADLWDRTTVRGYQLLNMMRGLPFDAKLSAEWLADDPPKPWGKIWQETKDLIAVCAVPYVNHLNHDRKLLDAGADIDAAKLLRCVRNHPRPLFNPLLDALLKWEAANPAQSLRPNHDEVFAVIAPEKERRHKSGEGWSLPAARKFCRAKLPLATNKQILDAYDADKKKFTAGRKGGNRAK